MGNALLGEKEISGLVDLLHRIAFGVLLGDFLVNLIALLVGHRAGHGLRNGVAFFVESGITVLIEHWLVYILEKRLLHRVPHRGLLDGVSAREPAGEHRHFGVGGRKRGGSRRPPNAVDAERLNVRILIGAHRAVLGQIRDGVGGVRIGRELRHEHRIAIQAVLADREQRRQLVGSKLRRRLGNGRVFVGGLFLGDDGAILASQGQTVLAERRHLRHHALALEPAGKRVARIGRGERTGSAGVGEHLQHVRRHVHRAMLVSRVGDGVGIGGRRHKLGNEDSIGEQRLGGARTRVAIAIALGHFHRAMAQVRGRHVCRQFGGSAVDLTFGYGAIHRLAHIPTVEHVAGTGRGHRARDPFDRKGHQARVLGNADAAALRGRVADGVHLVGFSGELRNERGVEIVVVLIDGKDVGQVIDTQLARRAYEGVNRTSERAFLAREPSRETVSRLGNRLATY